MNERNPKKGLCISVNSEFMQKLFAISMGIFEAIDWNKKTRIVVEYDPGTQKSEILITPEE